MAIRPANSTDAQGIADLWNAVIRDSIATFTDQEKSISDLQEMIAEKHRLSRGFYIVEKQGALLGFATYGPFRSGPGYAYTAEHSIYLSPEARGKGIGRTLMERLITHARDAGMHSLIAGLSGENLAAIKFHAALGFAKVADVKQAGFKFERWHDLVLMQKLL